MDSGVQSPAGEFLDLSKFLDSAKGWYGYDGQIEAIVEKDFKRLKGTTYLDHAGATLYAESQLQGFMRDLSSNVFGNPHSHNNVSKFTHDIIENVRYRILQHFKASPDEYAVVFTSGCTAALKLVAESFPWSSGKQKNPSAKLTEHVQPSNGEDVCSFNGGGDATSELDRQSRSVFCYLTDNHTSVIGIRVLAQNAGAGCLAVTPEEVESGPAQTSCGPKCRCDINRNTAADKVSESSVGHQCVQTQQDGGEPQSHEPPPPKRLERPADVKELHHLFAFPAQSNFTGRKYPLRWVTAVQERGAAALLPTQAVVARESSRWHVLLDAASLASTAPLDLSVHAADLVPISFYKLFGFPTGLGALLVRAPCQALLLKHRAYFGGGTAAAYLPAEDFYVPRDSFCDRFEDGTVSFLDIVALRHGFDTLEGLTGGMERVMRHAFSLARHSHHALASLHHGNGRPAVRLYGATDYEDPSTQGAIISFNVLGPDGDIVGYSQVDQLANLHGICLRTGCFCNTGACQMQLGISNGDVKKNLQAGHVCGDNMDLLDGRPTGAVRVSFGYMSTFHDAARLIRFITQCFVEERLPSTAAATAAAADICHGHSKEGTGPEKAAGTCSEELWSCTARGVDRGLASPRFGAACDIGHAMCPLDVKADGAQQETLSCSIADANAAKSSIADGRQVVLTNIFLYPVKSCAAFEVDSWPVVEQGLWCDRVWMVVTSGGTCLSQKREPRLCLIRPAVDRTTGQLSLTASGMKVLVVPLRGAVEEASMDVRLCHSKVCGTRVTGLDCEDEAAEWLTEFLGKSCRLIQQDPRSNRTMKAKGQRQAGGGAEAGASLSLANEAQYLLVNRTSVANLLCHVHERQGEVAGPPALDMEALVNRFRANLVVRSDEPYQEDCWETVTIGALIFQVTGGCSRCQMICIDQQTAERCHEPLRTLASQHRKKMEFGICLMQSRLPAQGSMLHVGTPVLPRCKDSSP
ncbi:molybdenum cofactor sulfurase isoform X1 [Lethenteron reissneri]|uniref:molybdenum cofactor sulfurase isoform X1 n=2 Tax=Lethenteron reissneri TaxID=7753 RepID=UPI002AB7DEDB|nr:molybdenum cofactor sulfurase isoform X1 [Lethenteron reissneri]